MRIAFDQQVFSFQQYGGISRYFCSLASHMSEIPGVRVKIVAPIHVNAYLPHVPDDRKVGIQVNARLMPDRMRISAARLMAAPMLRAFRPDIVHETYYSSRASAPKGAAHVLTVFDMIHERYPGNYRTDDPTRRWKKQALARADHVICISESTRRDLLEFLSVPAEKVSVVHLGFEALRSEAEVGDLPGFSPYILYVGHRGGYKNFKILANSFASSAWLRNNFRLVCFGGGAFTQAEKELLARGKVAASQVRQVGGGDTALAACYRNAAAFVYPSLYEGFGFPPLEAMSLGCPVVCSNTGSIPEVVGTAGEYFDPADIDSVRAALENVLKSSERQADLAAKGLERCALFSWERCAAETHAVYRKLLGCPAAARGA